MSRWPWALITGPCRGGPTLLGAFITRGWGVSCHADCVSCYQACSCWEGDVLIAALIPTKHPFMTELAAERRKTGVVLCESHMASVCKSVCGLI